MDDDLEPKPLSIFLSYSQKDIVLRDKFIASFYDQSLKESCTLWNDDKQRPGWNYDLEIRLHLGLADLILLLITPNFLSSRYCMDVELPTAKRRAAEEGIALMGVRLAETPFDDRLAGVPVWPRSGRPLQGDRTARSDHGSIIMEAKFQLAKQLKRDPVALAHAHLDYGVESWSRRSSIQVFSGGIAGCAAGAGWMLLCGAFGWSGALSIVTSCIVAWMAGVIMAHIIRVPEVTSSGRHKVTESIAFVLIVGLVSIVPGLMWGGLTGAVTAMVIGAFGWPAAGTFLGAIIGLLPGFAGAWVQALNFSPKHLRLFQDLKDPDPGLRRPSDLEDYEDWAPEQESQARKARRGAAAWADIPARESLAEASLDLEPADLFDHTLSEEEVTREDEPPVGAAPAAPPAPSKPAPERLSLGILYAPEDEGHVEQLCAALRSIGGDDMFKVERFAISDEAVLLSLQARMADLTLCVPLLTTHFSGDRAGFLAKRLAGEDAQNEKPAVYPVLVDDVVGPQHKLQALPRGGPVTNWQNPRAAWASVALALRENVRIEYLWLLEALHREFLWPPRDAIEDDTLDSLLEHLRRSARAERSSFARFAMRGAKAKRFNWSWRGLVFAMLAGAALVLALATPQTEVITGALVFGYAAARREGKQFLAMFARETDRVGLFDVLISPATTSNASRLTEADSRYARNRMAVAALRGAAGWCLPLVGLAFTPSAPSAVPVWAGALLGLLAYAIATSRVPIALCELPHHRIDDWRIWWSRWSLTVQRVRRDGLKVTTRLSLIDLVRSVAESIAIAIFLAVLLSSPLADAAVAGQGGIRAVAWACLAVLIVKILSLGLPAFPRGAIRRHIFFRTWISGVFSQAFAWLLLPALLVVSIASQFGLDTQTIRVAASSVTLSCLVALRWRTLIVQTVNFEVDSRRR